MLHMMIFDTTYRVLATLNLTDATSDRERGTGVHLWACDRLSDYLVRLHIQIYIVTQSVYTPFVPLFISKHLEDLPLRMQRLQLHMIRFHCTISHVPGKELTLADALSRALVSTFSLAYEYLQKECSENLFSSAVTSSPLVIEVSQK